MAIFEFQCLACEENYEEMTTFKNISKVKCPKCNSKKKKKLISTTSFAFSNPVGTDKYNNSHDYRFQHKLPEAKAQRAAAEKLSKSKNPYGTIDDISSGKNFGPVV